MNKNIWRQIVDFLGFGDDDAPEQDETTSYLGWKEIPGRKRGKVVPFASEKTENKALTVCRPTSFSDARGIVDDLMSGQPVVVNLTDTREEDARRLLDFISGSVYALQGQSQRIADKTFIFAPQGVKINSVPDVEQE